MQWFEKSGKRTKGPKPFTAEDKEKFRALFKKYDRTLKMNRLFARENFVKQRREYRNEHSLLEVYPFKMKVNYLSYFLLFHPVHYV